MADSPEPARIREEPDRLEGNLNYKFIFERNLPEIAKLLGEPANLQFSVLSKLSLFGHLSGKFQVFKEDHKTMTKSHFLAFLEKLYCSLYYLLVGSDQ